MAAVADKAVASATQCEYPVRFRRSELDQTTGEVRSREVLRRCGSRRSAECASCSALYKGDAFAVIRSELQDEGGNVRTATWVTLTAPGANVFGQVHSQRRDASGRVRPCGCQKRHADDDPLLGSPLDADAYQYERAADFNANASRLWAVTMQKLSRLLGRKLKVVRVVEYQSRGLVHVHALILGVVTKRSLEVAVRGGVNLRTGRNIQPATSNGWTWGPQCDAQVVTQGYARRLGAYMTKVVGYSVKSAGDDLPGGSAHTAKMANAGERACSCDHPHQLCRRGRRTMQLRRFVVAPDGTTDVVTVERP